MGLNIDKLRAAYPALAVTDAGKRRIYLDNPAGTQVPLPVADAIRDAILYSNANLGGFFKTTKASTGIWHDAHQAMADMFGAASPEEIVIGPNMTTLTYHLSRAIGRDWGAGDEIVVTRMDHEGNVGPWVQLAQDKGATVRFVPFSTESWQIEPEALSAVMNEKTRLVALTYASNLTGSVNPVKELVALARDRGVLTYVDAVQFAPHGFVDVAELGCDFLAASAYKFFGPHLGVVWGRHDVLDALVPYKLECATNDLPGRLETGTAQIELLAGLTACIDHLAETGAMTGESGNRRARIAAGFAASSAHESELALQLTQGLDAIEGVTVRGITDTARMGDRVPTVSFTVADILPASLAQLLADENIFVWSGHNYAWQVVHQLGIAQGEGVLRVGAAHYNTAGEIAETVEAVERNLGILRQNRGR